MIYSSSANIHQWHTLTQYHGFVLRITRLPSVPPLTMFSGDVTHRQNVPRPLHSLLKKEQRRPGPANPPYALPRSEWPTILARIEQGESYRQIAQDYHTSYQLTSRPENSGSGPNHLIVA